MTLLTPLMLFGWVPFTMFLFFIIKPHQAALVSVIGGCLFLPQFSYDLPGPDFGKEMAIALGLILGGRISGKRRTASVRWGICDLPMLIWIICPLATSLSNQLGVYDGISGVWGNLILWGIPYLAGRVYFDDIEKLRALCLGLIVGGLLYTPLCLFEIRMSPQLSATIYGFFPHSWFQHLRYDGFRPIVFMQHGLMVALWMAITTTAAFWLWLMGELRNVKGISMSVLVYVMIVTTLLCKSANGWITLFVGCGGYFVCRSFRSARPFRLFLLLVPFYILLRVTGTLEGISIESAARHIFDNERVASLSIRLLQEDLFIMKTMQQPLLGWGGYGRGWPVDPETGQKLVNMVDALWLIVFNTRGWVGLVSFVAGMAMGPWILLRSFRGKVLPTDFSMLGPVLLSFLVILFMIDSLVNGMVNPVYLLISGALACYAVHIEPLIDKTPVLSATVVNLQQKSNTNI